MEEMDLAFCGIGVSAVLTQGGLTNFIPPINISFLLFNPPPTPYKRINPPMPPVQNKSYNKFLISSINQRETNRINTKNQKASSTTKNRTT